MTSTQTPQTRKGTKPQTHRARAATHSHLHAARTVAGFQSFSHSFFQSFIHSVIQTFIHSVIQSFKCLTHARTARARTVCTKHYTAHAQQSPFKRSCQRSCSLSSPARSSVLSFRTLQLTCTVTCSQRTPFSVSSGLTDTTTTSTSFLLCLFQCSSMFFDVLYLQQQFVVLFSIGLPFVDLPRRFLREQNRGRSTSRAQVVHVPFSDASGRL